MQHEDGLSLGHSVVKEGHICSLPGVAREYQDDEVCARATGCVTEIQGNSAGWREEIPCKWLVNPR